MQPYQANKWITAARFAPYIAEADGDHGKAVELYAWNARISAAMFETLHHVEVILRNAVDCQFAPVDAGTAPRETWLEDPGDPERCLPATSPRDHREDLPRRQDTHPRTGRRGPLVRVLARPLRQKYDGLWVSHLYRAFPAGSGNRAEVAALMSKLVPFRNRLAHHETIMGRPIDTHYEEMLTLAGLIDPDARVWIEWASQVNEVLDARPG